MSNNRFQLSSYSQTALKAIYKHTTKEFGEEQANVYIKSLYQTFETLVDHPSIGKDISEYKPGLRKFRYRSHTLIYK